MIYAVSYANKKFKRAQRFNTRTAYKQKADIVYAFGPEDIDEKFYLQNKEILDYPRGNGYWLWKPYFIKRVMDEMQEGDFLIYSDAGLFYLNDLPSFFSMMDSSGYWMLGQGTGYKEYQYTKRDAFVYMGLDQLKYVESEQRNGILALKKCESSSKLVDEWLQYACDPRIITDAPNTCGLDNYEGFIENRHDQSIFSLLSKKYGVPQGCLFEEMKKRKESKAPLCYHHTVYGSILEILVRDKLDPFWWGIKRLVKKALRVCIDE